MTRWVQLSMMGLLVLASTACGSNVCSEQMRLDRLLGGGLPVCLGSPWTQVEEYEQNGRGEIDSQGWYSLSETGAQYTYLPQGGVDLVVTRVGGTVRKGCISRPADPNDPGEMAHEIMARLGGTWKRMEAPEGVSNWLSSQRIGVGYRFNRSTQISSTCVGLGLP